MTRGADAGDGAWMPAATPSSPFSLRLLRRPGFEIALIEAVVDGAHFPKHTHDEYVIGANLVGAERIWLDGRTHEAGPGDVTAYNPGALQAGGPLGPRGAPWRFVSLYVEPTFAADALGLLSPPMLPEPVIRHSRVASRLAALGRLALQESNGEDADLYDEAVVSVLAALAEGGPRAGAGAQRADPALERAAALLLDRLADPPSLAEVARAAGLSRARLVRRFGTRFGLPPMAWAMQRRLARARVLLRRGVPPAAVAAALGFADQPHLTRAFRATAGTTPGRYGRAP